MSEYNIPAFWFDTSVGLQLKYISLEFWSEKLNNDCFHSTIAKLRYWYTIASVNSFESTVYRVHS